ncbi:MAG: hypothetical protein ACLTV8_10445 [Thomasclavelia ramosa]
MVIVFILGVLLYFRMSSNDFKVSDDEIAMHIQLDTKEDIGLIVYDYIVDGHEYSGGIANADKSLISHDSKEIQVWNKQELNTSSDSVDISMNFRIITEYVDPNYENIYPNDITKNIELPISWNAKFGEEYFVRITGDNQNGYIVELNK